MSSIIGKRVVDEMMKERGIVFDVIGPVNSPFITVKLRAKDQPSTADLTSNFFVIVEKRRKNARMMKKKGMHPNNRRKRK
ncbi:MAG: hypothetical protein ACTSXU_02205 [Promethearchaeota archaeon]